MFNRSYQIRSSRGVMVSAGEILEELVERASDRQGFYRPRRRPRPGAKQQRSGKLQGVQLELFADRPSIVDRAPDPARPLADLFPEAESRSHPLEGFPLSADRRLVDQLPA